MRNLYAMPLYQMVTQFFHNLSSSYLYLLFILSLFSCLISSRKLHLESRFVNAFYKYSSRILLISAACLLLKHADIIITYSMNHFHWLPGDYYANIFIQHFRGPNCAYFFIRFMDIYVLASFLFLLPYSYYCDTRVPACDDKYASLVTSFLSLGSLVMLRKPFWNDTSKLGLQTVCVKIFFVPLLVTWVINNSIHQTNLSRVFFWNLATINAYLVALFIFIDTSIFCCGYLFEFDFLDSRIRSVEPSLLGWVVCLWCYPPFNQFSFSFFDHQWFAISRTYPPWVVTAVTCTITVLWGVFAWASVALGGKASNLTNRGIVAKGPYQFVRHPAYGAKLLIFYLQGIVLGHYLSGMLCGLTVIYLLRAWTEEQHLSRDPDYLDYKKSVRYCFIPKVI